jgi:2-dehydropantoate 2-reductase
MGCCAIRDHWFGRNRRHTGWPPRPLRVAGSVDEIDLDDQDVIILAVKSQDTGNVLQQVAHTAPPTVHIVCAQNGVSNEPVCESIARDWQAAGYSSRSVADIARWKYAKLLTNLGNAVEAVCGPEVRGGPLTELLQDEGRMVLDHHEIGYVSAVEGRARLSDLLLMHDIDGPRPGGSLWQSVQRGQSTEVDHLSGEIVRLARLAGLAAPANELMQRLVQDVTAGALPAASVSEQHILAKLSVH